MHDWTLITVNFDWQTGCVCCDFKKSELERVSLIAKNVASLFVPKLEEWGESVSVNKVLGPIDDGLFQRLIIEMQSGDEIVILAKHFIVPE